MERARIGKRFANSPVANRVSWSSAAGAWLRTARARIAGRETLSPEELASALYRVFLDREPDLGALSRNRSLPTSAVALKQFLLGLPEFRAWMLKAVAPRVELPDLTLAMPECYRKEATGDFTRLVYTARMDEDVARMASLIERHRYYDALGVWSPVIDLDKEVTAAIVRGLGAKSCFELGCYTGPVLSLLAEAGLSVAGLEVSHTAFAFAYPNIREAILFGDLLSLNIGRRFDAILCMDVLEHVSPLVLDRYVEKLVSLLDEDGFLYLNSPMYGHDPVFGTVFHPDLEEWRTAGDGSFWRDWPCDEKGWPQHGHLVWASVGWWSRTFERHGLVRDRAIEQVIQQRLAGFFEREPARRSLFILRRVENRRGHSAVASLDAALANMPNLLRARR